MAKPKEKEIKEEIIKWQKCGAHFKGKDGKGTCSSNCQWFTGKVCGNSEEFNQEIEKIPKELKNEIRVCGRCKEIKKENEKRN